MQWLTGGIVMDAAGSGSSARTSPTDVPDPAAAANRSDAAVALFTAAAAHQIPVKINAPGAVARQLRDFGIVDGAFGAEYFTLDAGTELAPLLAVPADDSCHCAHWGHMITGDVVVTYRDGTNEHSTTSDVFHWPPDTASGWTAMRS
jgi:hypothetical protein